MQLQVGDRFVDETGKWAVKDYGGAAIAAREA